MAKDAAISQRADELYELGLRAARFLRAKFPRLKIIAGNSWGSLGITAVLLRRGSVFRVNSSITSVPRYWS